MPGRHQWLQSWLPEEESFPDFLPYIDGWPSILYSDNPVMFKNVMGVLICFMTSFAITFFSPEEAPEVCSGWVASLQLPPEFHWPPLFKWITFKTTQKMLFEITPLWSLCSMANLKWDGAELRKKTRVLRGLMFLSTHDAQVIKAFLKAVETSSLGWTWPPSW